MQLVVYFLPFIIPVVLGVALLIRCARKHGDTPTVTGLVRTNPVLLASGAGLWIGSLGAAAVTLTSIIEAYIGMALVERPFGLPVTIPMIRSFYPNDPHPAWALVALGIATLGLIIGAFGLCTSARLDEQTVGAYLARVLLPVRAVLLATVLFAVMWGLGAALD